MYSIASHSHLIRVMYKYDLHSHKLSLVGPVFRQPIPVNIIHHYLFIQCVSKNCSVFGLKDEKLIKKANLHKN